MADPEQAEVWRRHLRENERLNLYWKEEALKKDEGRYTTGELAKKLKEIDNQRAELDRQEALWRQARGDDNFSPDVDRRKTQNREAVEDVRRMVAMDPERQGRGKGYKSAGKKSAPRSPTTEKELEADHDMALEDRPLSDSEQESGSDSESESTALAARSDASTSDNSGDREVRERVGLYDDLDSDTEDFEAEQKKRDEDLDAYELDYFAKKRKEVEDRLTRLQEAVEFFESVSRQTVKSVEACEDSMKSVMDALENRDNSKKDCEETLALFKTKAEDLRSHVAQALVDAYSTEEIAESVEENRAYAAEALRDGRDPYAQAQERAAKTKENMFNVIKELREENVVTNQTTWE